MRVGTRSERAPFLLSLCACPLQDQEMLAAVSLLELQKIDNLLVGQFYTLQVFSFTTVYMLSDSPPGTVPEDTTDSSEQPFTELLISARMKTIGLKLYFKDHHPLVR